MTRAEVGNAFFRGFFKGLLGEQKPQKRPRSPLARAAARPELVPAVGREPAPAPGQVVENVPGDMPVIGPLYAVFPVRPPRRFRKVVLPDQRTRTSRAALTETFDASVAFAGEDETRSRWLDQQIAAEGLSPQAAAFRRERARGAHQKHEAISEGES